MICSIEKCERTALCRGWCMRHYNRWRRHGDPTTYVHNTIRHGGWKTPTYGSWHSMISRCYTPSTINYAGYGGRGIKVCERWLGERGFINFRNDMGERPTSKSVDRIDNDGDYSPENCKWSTPKEQQSNRRPNTYKYCAKGHRQAGRNRVTIDGKKVCRRCL